LPALHSGAKTVCHLQMLPAIAAAHKQASADKDKPPNRQIGSDSVIGANLNVGEKSTVKRSSIGKNVQIGKDCKISGSIVMDGVSLGDGCARDSCVYAVNSKSCFTHRVKLDGCIVGPYARISSGSNLTRCEVAFKTEVLPESMCTPVSAFDILTHAQRWPRTRSFLIWPTRLVITDLVARRSEDCVYTYRFVLCDLIILAYAPPFLSLPPLFVLIRVLAPTC
jgi:carbonic anhydrase/acetyltransferase-like protein (isoleucine patch superfamily)